MKTFYRQRLPHIHPIGAIFFVTFNLNGAIPRKILQRLDEKFANDRAKIIRGRYSNQDKLLYELKEKHTLAKDQLLDKMQSGPRHLSDANVSKILWDRIFEFDQMYYDLLALTIMSNHVHLLIDTSIQVMDNKRTIPQIMHLIKGGSAYQINNYLNRTGQLWQYESYDHYVRNKRSLSNIRSYILENPVKAGFCKKWYEWPFNYLKIED